MHTTRYYEDKGGGTFLLFIVPKNPEWRLEKITDLARMLEQAIPFPAKKDAPRLLLLEVNTDAVLSVTMRIHLTGAFVMDTATAVRFLEGMQFVRIRQLAPLGRGRGMHLFTDGDHAA